MIKLLVGFVLGSIATALVYRHNNAKANSAVDKGMANAKETAAKIKAKL